MNVQPQKSIKSIQWNHCKVEGGCTHRDRQADVTSFYKIHFQLQWNACEIKVFTLEIIFNWRHFSKNIIKVLENEEADR